MEVREMQAYISIINESVYPAISVLFDDIILFKDILHTSAKKPYPAGSVQVIVLDNRQRTMHDLYIGLSPDKSYILKVHTKDCILIQSGFP